MFKKFGCFTSPESKVHSKNVQGLGGGRSIVRSKQEQEARAGSSRTKRKTDGNNLSNKGIQKHSDLSAADDFWNDNYDNDNGPEDTEEFYQRMNIHRVQFGNIDDEERDVYGGNDDLDGMLSFNRSDEQNMTRMNRSFYDITSHDQYGQGSSFRNQLEDNDLVPSLDMITNNARHEPLFPKDAMQQMGEGRHAVNKFMVDTDDQGMELRGKSPENLKYPWEYDDMDNNAAYDFRHYNRVANVRNEFNTDAVKLKNVQKGSPILKNEEVNPQELSMRRLENWFGQLDTEVDPVLLEPGETSSSLLYNKEPQVDGDVLNPSTMILDDRTHLGMEAARKYISSLTPTSSTAQMENLGLVAVPLLSAFPGLRVLNLSGNSIGHLTAGALPRGLHTLYLSKNNITGIEGLRGLTKLRVLDLSYNQISKIHGLDTCSSLKELYLAGNKITDVEGLNRLPKLTILDLRSNKISTSKGLGQLASNRDSLQAINLENNPAQTSMGDDKLKKYLLSILPNLVYYNKQTMKSNSKRENSVRTPRSPPENNRIEPKITPKSSNGSGSDRSYLNPLRPSPGNVGALLRQPKGRNVESPLLHLTPLGSKLPYLRSEVDKQEQTPPSPNDPWKPKDQWAEMVQMGLGGSMAAVLNQPRR